MFWLLTIFSIVGTILNIYKKRSGFLVWMITNIIWAVIDFDKNMPEQGVLFMVYAGLAIWGWFSWKGVSNAKANNAS